MTKVTIREHKIPSAGSKPYIAVEGPDGALWFCESGASKIGRFDPDRGSFTEFSLPTKNATPIGIALGGDGNLWFAEKAADKIGRITPRGAIAEFALPAGAGPDGMILGPDGNVWFSESDANRIAKITPDGRITEYGDGISPGAKPLVDRGARRRAVVFRSRRQPHRPHHDRRRGHRVSDSEPRQPAARHGQPSRRQHLVRRDLDQCARPHRPRTAASPSIRCRRRTPRCAALPSAPAATSGTPRTSPTRSAAWRPDGTVRGEYDIPTPNSGARCIAALADGRLFFTQYDAGAIGEVCHSLDKRKETP